MALNREDVMFVKTRKSFIVVCEIDPILFVRSHSECLFWIRSNYWIANVAIEQSIGRLLYAKLLVRNLLR